MTIAEIIDIAKVSQFLSLIDIRERGLFAGGIDIQLPRKLYTVRKTVERTYELNPTDDTLIGTSNYLYALCGKYGLAAQSMLSSGGSISPVSPPSSSLPFPLYFVVSGSSPIPDGSGSATFSDFIGYNLVVARNNIPQSTVNDGGTYFSWNRLTGLFKCFPNAMVSETFSITPVG